jgi:hypothetical protein
MARSPYQGTYQHGIRPTVVTAPDAIVYLNGETDIIGCPQCKRRFAWNKYITSIQVDLNVQSAPGSASFTLSIPRHTVDEFFFDGNPLVTPMMEVEIYAKGHFVVEGVPQYYPIFWGLVTEVSHSFSGAEHTVSVNCSDILKWWELCKMNINPAFTQSVGQMGRNLFGNVYSGENPYDIIWSLAQQSFGDVIVGSGSLLSLYKENSQRATFKAALADLMVYWEERFSHIRSNLLLYGTQGNAVRGDELQAIYGPGGSALTKNAISQAVRKANGGSAGSQMVYDPTDSQVTAFRTQFMNAGQVNFWQSEFQTKLELANAAKDCIGYEFYMDVTGDIVFKPPFYNVDVLGNKPVSWIQDIDVISWDLSESEAEVVTQLQISGAYGGNIEYGFGEEMTPATSVTDYHLLRKYGWRVETFNSEFMGSTLSMFYMGLDLLDRMNAQRFRATVTIPMRAELRLGFPVYLASQDQIWYVTGISHNLQFGGQATTTLSLTAKRTKFVAPKGIGSLRLDKLKGGRTYTSKGTLNEPTPPARALRNATFKGDVGEAAQLPPTNYPENPGEADPYEPLILRHPKTGRLVGYPNVVMAYTRPFAPTPEQYGKVAGKRKKGSGRGAKPSFDPKKFNDAAKKIVQDEFNTQFLVNDIDRARERYLNNRFVYGLNSAGVFTYLHESTSVIKEMLLIPKQNVAFKDEDTGKTENLFQGKTAMIRPVSDERGFEVIGHYKYGRNVSLRDGSLVLNETAENPGALNSRAEVRPQVALTGGLTETLQAQSQGLVTVNTGFPNPSRMLATLRPDDLQTAGVVNPETGDPEFVNTDTNFIDVAPLGTAAQKGTNVSVEASQLSRALTLAELSVKTEEANPGECGCLLGRSDLAFINVGYQVKVLNSSAPDKSSLSFGQGGVTQTSTKDDEIFSGVSNYVESSLSEYPGFGELSQEDQEALRSKFQNEGYQIQAKARGSSVERVQESYNKGLLRDVEIREYAELTGQSYEDVTYQFSAGELDVDLNTRPVAATIMSREETVSKIEEYLATLYRVLDGPHQEFEKTIRGELVEGPPVNAEEVRFGRGFNPQDEGGFKPPFNPMGRERGGDLDAIAQQGSSARQDLQKSFEEFGDKLKAGSKRTELEGRKRSLEERVLDLRAAVKEREEFLDAEGTLVTSTASTLEDLERALADAEQDLRDVAQELNVLNKEFPQ